MFIICTVKGNTTTFSSANITPRGAIKEAHKIARQSKVLDGVQVYDSKTGEEILYLQRNGTKFSPAY